MLFFPIRSPDAVLPYQLFLFAKYPSLLLQPCCQLLTALLKQHEKKLYDLSLKTWSLALKRPGRWLSKNRFQSKKKEKPSSSRTQAPAPDSRHSLLGAQPALPEITARY